MDVDGSRPAAIRPSQLASRPLSPVSLCSIPVPAPTTTVTRVSTQPRNQNPLSLPQPRQHHQPLSRIIIKYRHPHAVAVVAPATEFFPVQHLARPSR